MRETGHSCVPTDVKSKWQGMFWETTCAPVSSAEMPHAQDVFVTDAFPPEATYRISHPTPIWLSNIFFFNLTLFYLPLPSAVQLQKSSSTPIDINSSLSSSTSVWLYLYSPYHCLRTKDISAEKKKFSHLVSYSGAVPTLFSLAHHGSWTCAKRPCTSIFSHA